MPLTIWNCVLSLSRIIILVKNSLLIKKLLHNRFSGSIFVLPTFLTGGKLGFQVANLLLATVNFKLYKPSL